MAQRSSTVASVPTSANAEIALLPKGITFQNVSTAYNTLLMQAKTPSSLGYANLPASPPPGPGV
ncbi:hypothetical protein EST38_g13513 [Candolleomyces aberdarensis]|uniref:Uncharacterized protein n=1 Tax=Candolleomyces aberdarensis TaxID=2316362 RepID=A0A4Q2D211_9AGAR|nr:hypothetical protein EST38_g13513 [Candolleomyces aberdarensis]